MEKNKISPYFPYAAIIIYLLFNIWLIVWVFKDLEFSNTLLWLTLILTIGLSFYFIKLIAGQWPINAIIVFGILFIGIGVSYISLMLLPGTSFLIRLIKMSLVIFCGLALLPASFHLGHKHPDNNYDLSMGFFPHDNKINLPRVKLVIIWSGVAIFIFSFYLILVALRSDILGYDTPTYIFRSRLIEVFGIEKHAEIGGGYQIIFPLISMVIHRMTGLDYIDVVRLLPVFIMTLICLASGYLAYLMLKSHTIAIVVSLFTAAWGLSPHLIVNARDNITVMLFGILGMICLIKSKGINSWIFELFQYVFLILAGLSHLTLSSIFFITTFHVNVIEFYNSYWRGEHKELFKQLWKVFRVPLISGLVILFLWSQVIWDFVNSLGVGLITASEVWGISDHTFAGEIKRYNIMINLPLIIFGFIVLVWNVISDKNARSFRVLFAWSTICIIFGIILKPISYINGRFLAMTPFFLLMPLGINVILKKNCELNQGKKILIQLFFSVVLLGVLLISNIKLNSILFMKLPGLPTEYYQNIDVINQYIYEFQSPPPYLFLVEDVGKYSDSNSDLWQRIIRAKITDEGLTNSYVYFGTLEYLIRGTLTPENADGLPPLKYKETFSAVSQKWFDIILENEVLNNKRFTVFIIDTYNPEMFSKYEFLPIVDKVAKGILVVNIPNDLINIEK